jgi:hypothetical protein
MEIAPEDRNRLNAAWRAMLDRAVREGFPETLSAETMLEVALSRLHDRVGPQQAAWYLDELQRGLRERTPAQRAPLKVALGPADEAFQWSETQGVSRD